MKAASPLRQPSPVRVFMDYTVEIPVLTEGPITRLLSGFPQGLFRPDRIKVSELEGRPVVCLNGRYVQLDEYQDFFLCREQEEEVLGERYYCSQSHTVQPGELLTFMFVNQTKEKCRFKIRVEGTSVGGSPGRIGYFNLWIPEDEITKTLTDMVKKRLESS